MNEKFVLILRNHCLLILLLLVGFNAISQRKTTDSFGNSSQYCSNTFCLYSDSTFTFERGCEGQSWITFGTFNYVKDTLILVPVQKDTYKPVKQIDLIDTDTSTFLNVELQAEKDSSYRFQAEVVFTSVETAEKWKRGQLTTSDLVPDSSLVKFVFEPYGGYVRTTSDPIAACLIQIERLISSREFVILESKRNRALIRMRIAGETLQKMNLYETEYKDMKASFFTFEGRKIRVVLD